MAAQDAQYVFLEDKTGAAIRPLRELKGWEQLRLSRNARSDSFRVLGNARVMDNFPQK